MDLKQLEYILKIAEENNITHAAKKLYITQSALNQQLLKLEKELGTPLFHRSRSNWRLTPAGEIYIAASKRILQIKQDSYNQIYDLEKQTKGKLSVGFTPNRGTALFSTVYPQFHKKFPQVMVEPMELSVLDQLDRIEDHSLDIGFLTLPTNQKKNSLTYLPMKSEEILLAVPSIGPYNSAAISEAGCKLPILSLRQMKGESFVLLYKKSTIRSLVDALFQSAGYLPNILFETASTYTILNMIETGLCCGFIPAYYMDNENKNITYYALPEHPSWDVVACYHSENYISEAAKAFIELARTFWNSDHPGN
ncbi:MAG: LysR family transcriptional regulator [Lachnospiraceae bacterium]